MKEQLYFMKFGVADLEEVKLLVEVWKAVEEAIRAEKPAKNEMDALMNTHDSVWVTVDKKQGTDKDVLLEFLAPLNVIDQFLKALRQQGLNLTQEFDTEGPVILCRLIPRAPEP